MPVLYQVKFLNHFIFDHLTLICSDKATHLGKNAIMDFANMGWVPEFVNNTKQDT